MSEIMSYLAILLAAVNMMLIAVVIFVERKRPEVALCWILALVFLPIIGCILYLFFGISLPFWQKRSLHAQRRYQKTLSTSDSVYGEEERLIRMNEQFGEGGVECDNRVEVFINGAEKYSSLLADIEKATDTIHLLYFIIRSDRLGRHLLERLTQKARQGVRVRLLYDHGGSFFTSDEIFTTLRKAGGEVARFFPLRWGYYLRVNYRNHRKIVVIDGKIGYLGGMNVGEEYLGTTLDDQVPWRDSHLRIEGSSVHDLQRRFLADWQFAGRSIADDATRLFPKIDEVGDTAVQIVSSGPYRKVPLIKWNYLRMIYGARCSIWLQTPYFVPDESFLEALASAAMSGVDVRLLLSSRSDNRIVQKVSISYARELWHSGVQVAFYAGFLHAKMGIVDARTVTLGTSNLDRRSFGLNFETNAILYDESVAAACCKLYLADWQSARKIKRADDWKQSVLTRAEESLGRLVAPLL